VPVIGGDKGGIAKTQLLFQAARSLRIEEKRSNYKSTNKLHPKIISKNSLALLILNCKKMDAREKCITTDYTDLRKLICVICGAV